MKTTAPEVEVLQVVNAEHHDPFHVLGAHLVEIEGKMAVAIRAFLPEAVAASVLSQSLDHPQPMEKIHPAGFFEAVIENRSQLFAYRLQLTNWEGHSWELLDPYSFWPVLTDFDLHLLGEGSHFESYEKLGAHLWDCGGVSGVLFAVWAPNASRVSVIGDFNSWDSRRHPMRSRLGSGIWELFVPGLGEGDCYKFELRSRLGDYIVQKSDPFGYFNELRPKTGSIVRRIDRYAWNDADWVARRAQSNGLDRPISIYEVHLGSWKRNLDETHSWMGYREMAHQLVDYVKEMGFTHIELLPISEHPFDGSWGYQSTGYYAVTSRYGSPEDFQYFVDQCHQKDIGVILDWVPAHFPMDEHGLRYFDGTFLYEHADPRMGQHRDWGTAIFNFGRTEVRNFLISNALFWLDKYHVDGFRVDAVASMLYLDYSREPGEWIPNQYGGNENLEAVAFLKDLNTIVHGRYPGVLTIAEESTAWPMVSHPVYLGGLGFSLKWNMGWMHDMLLYFSNDPIYRKFHHNNLTFSLLYAFTENFMLVLSHDEVVHGKRSLLSKMPGDMWQQFANLRSLYAFMFAHPGKKMLFMGGEFGQWIEWNAKHSLDWHLLEYESHHKLQHLVVELNRLYRSEPALYEVDFEHAGFDWVDFRDADSSVVVFLRWSRDRSRHVVVACNFTPVPRYGYRIGVPEASFYREVLNTDAVEFGGSGITNSPGQQAIYQPWQNQPFSLELTLPPLGVAILRPDR
jgi:1,4-alpha-glucan branching enzyme